MLDLKHFKYLSENSNTYVLSESDFYDFLVSCAVPLSVGMPGKFFVESQTFYMVLN